MDENTLIILKLVSITTSILIYLTYTLYIKHTFGKTWSISASYYKLLKRDKILFSVYIWGMSLPLLSFCFNPVKHFLIIAIALISFVGAYPLYRDKRFEIVHIACATGGIVMALLSLWMYNQLWISSIVFGVLALLCLFTKNKTWNIEEVSYLVVIISLILTIY